MVQRSNLSEQGCDGHGHEEWGMATWLHGQGWNKGSNIHFKHDLCEKTSIYASDQVQSVSRSFINLHNAKCKLQCHYNRSLIV